MSDVHPKDVELYRGLEPKLGADVATLLLARLPPLYEELATKADLVELRTELTADMTELRTELRSDLAGLRGELKGEIHDAVGSAFRNVLIGLGAIMFAATSSAAVLAGAVG